MDQITGHPVGGGKQPPPIVLTHPSPDLQPAAQQRDSRRRPLFPDKPQSCVERMHVYRLSR
jgi:hypothetical protein